MLLIRINSFNPRISICEVIAQVLDKDDVYLLYEKAKAKHLRFVR